jgi:hypothetical protein
LYQHAADQNHAQAGADFQWKKLSSIPKRLTRAPEND